MKIIVNNIKHSFMIALSGREREEDLETFQQRRRILFVILEFCLFSHHNWCHLSFPFLLVKSLSSFMSWCIISHQNHRDESAEMKWIPFKIQSRPIEVFFLWFIHRFNHVSYLDFGIKSKSPISGIRNARPLNSSPFIIKRN